MGFAGQVFAARVAIGLAVPSPQALSKTGSMLARAITNIQKRIEMARGGRGDIATKYGLEMAAANKKTLSLTDKMNNEIVIVERSKKMGLGHPDNYVKIYVSNFPVELVKERK